MSTGVERASATRSATGRPSCRRVSSCSRKGFTFSKSKFIDASNMLLPSGTAPRSLLQLANPDVAKRQRAGVIALNAEIALRRLPEVRKLLRVELARLDRRVPVGAADVVRRDLLPVQPVLDVFPPRDDARLVPLVGGRGGILGGGEEVVHRSREVVVLLVVGRVHVVEQLVLGRAPVDLVELVGAAIEHAA